MTAKSKLNLELIFWTFILVMSIEIHGQSTNNYIRTSCVSDLNPRSLRYMYCRIPIGPLWKGDRGLPGPKGDIGTPGVPGISIMHEIHGRKGVPGERGPKGEQGQRGAKGESGDTSTITESEFNDLQKEVRKIIENIKKLEENKPLPPGPKGERGETGNPGEPGQRGPMGPKGQRGQKGTRGEKGGSGVSTVREAAINEEIIRDLQIRITELERKLQDRSCEPTTTAIPPPPLPADDTLRGKLLRELRKMNESECVSYALRYYSECSENEPLPS